MPPHHHHSRRLYFTTDFVPLCFFAQHASWLLALCGLKHEEGKKGEIIRSKSNPPFEFVLDKLMGCWKEISHRVVSQFAYFHSGRDGKWLPYRWRFFRIL